MQFGISKTSTKQHIVNLRRKWYSGMTETALCGARVDVTARVASSHPNAVQPADTCVNCAKQLGQRVAA